MGSPLKTEENKAVARRFFELFTASDIDGALNTMADDATWWIPGKKERSPNAGLYPKTRSGACSIGWSAHSRTG